ncbi:transcription antitermination factor NusB [Streptobacillus moniliformis]|uniref:transcription antitermination factor NusB n=1 Tax=Streptobacillus moniliformis TaxID=34105 RepID=UPI0007E4DA71|nr:transcription antitermination factor NusB [Streptobacillus moniliformis]
MKIKKDLIILLDEVIENKKYSNLQLKYMFENNSYTKGEKAFLNNMLNVTLKNLIYIDYVILKLARSIKRKTKQILRLSIAQILYTSTDIAGVIYEAVELGKEENIYQANFINSTLRNFIRKKDEIFEITPENIKLSYPIWFYDKVRNQFGEDKFREVLKRYKGKSTFSVRVNHKKISVNDFKDLLKMVDSEILFNISDVYYLNNNNVLKTKAYLTGDIVIQDGSSLLVVDMLAPSNEDEVLDVAAAPGGKSLAILQKYNPKKLVATDIHEHKVNMLKEFESKYMNFKAILADGREFSEGIYDKILLDVPCSGLGVLTKKPEKVYEIDLKVIKAIKKLQKKIFDNTYKLLKNGGEMVYSTCTILENENTNNVAYFLEKYSDLEVVDFEFPQDVKIIKDEFGGNLISYENEYLDGFYMIKFRKK